MSHSLNLSGNEVEMSIYLCIRAIIDPKTRPETHGSRALDLSLRVRVVSMRCIDCPGINLIGDFSLWLGRYLGI